MIRATDIHKSFGTLEVLKGVSLDVAQGEVVSIVGASGAGKTTLLQIIGTLSRPDGGRVEIDGRDVSALGDRALSQFRNERIGFVFQFHHLLAEFTAFENVCIPGLIGRRPRVDVERRAAELLDMMGLAARRDHKPGQLSGGEQQRVALARALANNADLIIADEPTGNVDPRMSLEIVDLLMRLNSEGTTVIMVTHEHNLVRMYDKRVILLENGTVAADGKMKNSAHREIKMKGSLGRPADGFATKYLDDEDGEAGKPGKLSEKAAEIANETAADDAYRQALESFGKEKAEYGSEYDTSYSSAAADYSIYLEDGEGDESNEK